MIDSQHYTRVEKYAENIYQMYLKTLRDITRLFNSLQIDSSKPFNFNDYPQIKQRVNTYFTDLFKSVNVQIENAINWEWEQAEIKNDGIVETIIKKRKLTKAQEKIFYSRNESAKREFIQRKVDGLKLSDRVWLYTTQFKDEIEKAIDVAISEKISAQDLSQTVRQYLQQPDRLFRRVRDKNGVLKLSKAAADYHPGRGVYRSSYKNAMRLARTEINMAYRTSDHNRMNDLPFIKGFRVVTSNNHPVRDICDDLKGEYPKEFKFTGWHPQCRCHVISIMISDKEYNSLEDRLLNGEDVSKYNSPTSIKNVPKGFNEWIDNNKERAKSWRSLPYFMRDNPKFVGALESIEKPINLKPSKFTGYENITFEENNIRNNKSFETAKVFDSDGNLIFTKKGRSHSVGFNDSDKIDFTDKIFTHNHPSGAGYKTGNMLRIGNSFSIADVVFAVTKNVSEMRAVTPEFTFIIKRPANGWGSKEKLSSVIKKANNEIYKDFGERINNGTTTAKKANIVHWHALWKKVSNEVGFEYLKQRL